MRTFPESLTNHQQKLGAQVIFINDNNSEKKVTLTLKQNRSIMKKILVPTDFSATARHAMAYALELSKTMDHAHIDLVHMYLPATAAEYPNIVPPIAEMMEAQEKMLANFADEVRKRSVVSTPITSHLIVGFPADEIVRLSEEYDLVVIGATGESDVLDNMFGSVSGHVARKSKCPVILVPKGVTFQPIENILFASNYESADSEMIRSLIDFNKMFGAKLHFVHVRNEDPADDFEKTRDLIFSDLSEKGEPAFSFEIEEIEGGDVHTAIQAFAERSDIDLVVMVVKKRGFWDGLFHRSQTRQMALNTTKPLMMLHLE